MYTHFYIYLQNRTEYAPRDQYNRRSSVKVKHSRVPDLSNLVQFEYT